MNLQELHTYLSAKKDSNEVAQAALEIWQSYLPIEHENKQMQKNSQIFNSIKNSKISGKPKNENEAFYASLLDTLRTISEALGELPYVDVTFSDFAYSYDHREKIIAKKIRWHQFPPWD